MHFKHGYATMYALLVINRVLMDKDILQGIEDSVRLLAILVKRNNNQTQVIKEMAGVGFSPKRIAELLDTTPNNVSVSLHNARNPKKNKKQ